MSIALAVLADRLQRAVPQRDGAPADYEQLAQDAVAQLSQDAPIVTSVAIQVTAGLATYDLPADFLFLIALEGAPGGGGIINSDAGLVPMLVGWRERAYIEGAVLRLEPMPTYTATRTLRYAAAHRLAGGAYPRLSENGTRVALLYGQHLALSEQATAVAPDEWSYKIGDESVDKRGVGAAIRGQAAAALQSYRNAIEPMKGHGSQHRQNPYAVTEAV